VALVSDTVLGADTASFDITGIPGSYKHLKLCIVGRSTRAASVSDTVSMRFNNDSGANYDDEQTQIVGGGTFVTDVDTATAFTLMGLIPAASSAAGCAGRATVDLCGYADTTFRKSYVALWASEVDDADHRLWQSSGAWRNTSAINRVTLFPQNGNWLAGSRLTVYGLS
jgi:hypothetical protein